MYRKIFILLLSILLTGCAKGFTPLKRLGRDTNIKLNESFKYAPISDIFEHENREYEHLIIDDNAFNDKKINALYDLEVKIAADNLKHLDDIGDVFFGEDYSPEKWAVQTTDYGTEESPYEHSSAAYLTDEYTLSCDSSTLMYLCDTINFDVDLFPPDAYREDYPKSQAEKAKEIINKLYQAIGKTPPEFYGAVYLEGSNTWEFDFRQNIRGLNVTDIAFRRNDTPGNIISDEFANLSFYGKCSVFINEKGDLSVCINQYYLNESDINAQYDTAIALDSALDFMDKNIAANSNYTVKNAELQYMLVMHEVEGDDKNKSYALKTAPAWVFELVNYTEDQRYCCVINAISGDHSFVKVNGEINE